MTGDLWSAQPERPPTHVVDLGNDFYGTLFDGEPWVTPPPKYVNDYLESAREHNRPVILGDRRAYFEIELCVLAYPSEVKRFRQIGAFIKVRLWPTFVAAGKN